MNASDEVGSQLTFFIASDCHTQAEECSKIDLN